MNCPHLPKYGGYHVPCGQCIPCLINKKRNWTSRLIQESLCHPFWYFVTLTYDEKNVQYVNLDKTDPTLVPSDLNKFLRTLRNTRRKTQNGSFRYYACGEYGDRTHRPHYHAIIYSDVAVSPDEIQESWDKGFTAVAPGTLERAAYTCGYVTKKLNRKDSPNLRGRHPEFAVQSRNPGIAAPFAEQLGALYKTGSGSRLLERDGDIQPSFRYKGKEYPLSPYTSQKVREILGIPSNLSERARSSVAAQSVLDNLIEPNPETRAKQELTRLRVYNEDGTTKEKYRIKPRNSANTIRV